MEERKFFNKWCYICDKKYKVHFTPEQTKMIMHEYGSLRRYPRHNSMCLVCSLKIQSFIVRTPCKCRKCSKYFWMYKTHLKYEQAKEMFLERKRFWMDYCPECDVIFQRSSKLQQLHPKPKQSFQPKDIQFFYTCQFLEKNSHRRNF